jgi:hypothetical protein
MCSNIRCDGVKSFWVETKQGLNKKETLPSFKLWVAVLVQVQPWEFLT